MGELIEGDPGVIDDGLTGRIIGAAVEVHRRLGPGFLETVYQRALRCELTARKIDWAAEVEVPVLYRGVVVGRHRLDMVVDGTVVVELKAIGRLEFVHFAQVRSYLAASGMRVGLLLNFDSTRVTIRRVVDQASKDLLRGSGVPAPLPVESTCARMSVATPVAGV
jgi:GxxExxY protein